MKKILTTTLLFVTFISFSNTKTETNCTEVYRATRDAAQGQGFNQSEAQQIGAAAYYACKNENYKKKQLTN